MALSNDPLSTGIQNNLEQLQLERLTRFNGLADVHVALQSALLNEAQRIEAKLGAQDIRSQQLRGRAQENAQAAQALKIEAQFIQTNVPDPEPEAALLY